MSLHRIPEDSSRTVEATLDLLTEGQKLKQRLREQYATEINAAMASKKGLTMDDANLSSVLHDNTTLDSQSKASIRQMKDNAPNSPSRRDLINASNIALADAEERERRLKALIDSHSPIRASLRTAQEHAMKSLIAATESSLAWEIKLAAEEADPFSPVHEGHVSDPTEEQTSSSTPLKFVTNREKTSLQTSPFREEGSRKEKEMLEKRLDLLLKLQAEHKYSAQVEAALLRSGVSDERKRFVEEAVDVVAIREMERQQLAKRVVANVVSDGRFEAVDASSPMRRSPTPQ